MKQLALIAVLCLLVAGCASYSTPVPLPSGDAGFSIWCEEFKSRCYTKAAKACPGGYDVINADTGRHGALTSTVGIFVSTYEMLIKCKRGGSQSKEDESTGGKIQQCIDVCIENTSRSPEQCFDACMN